MALGFEANPKEEYLGFRVQTSEPQGLDLFLFQVQCQVSTSQAGWSRLTYWSKRIPPQLIGMISTNQLGKNPSWLVGEPASMIQPTKKCSPWLVGRCCTNYKLFVWT
jgi:hypothetical protein